jgi:hypothetical protein
MKVSMVVLCLTIVAIKFLVDVFPILNQINWEDGRKELLSRKSLHQM